MDIPLTEIDELPYWAKVRDRHGIIWWHMPEGYWVAQPSFDEPESWIRVQEYAPLTVINKGRTQ